MGNGTSPMGLGLKSPDPTVRLQALYRIGNSRVSDRAADVLQLMKEDKDWAVKAKCGWVLGRLRHREAYPYLVANLKHPSPQVRIWSAWALGQSGLERATKHLQDAIDREPEEEVRQAVGGALKKLAGIPTRIHRSKLLRALRLPWVNDEEIMRIVARLEQLTWPKDKDDILTLRARIRDRNPTYFAKYMLWLRRKPGIEGVMDDDDIIFS